MAQKLKKKQKQEENTCMQVVKPILEYMTGLTMVLLSVFLPLYMKEGYYQIGTAKYKAFAYIVVFLFPILIVCTIIYFIAFIKQRKDNKKSGFEVKSLLYYFDVTDYFVLAYLLFTLISYFACGHLKDAFWGYDGWFMGLFSQVAFLLIYLFCSRFGRYDQAVLVVLGLVAYITYVIGVLHRLNIDPIGVYDGIADYYKQQFLSTLGQNSWYSSFICLVLPLGMVCYQLCSKIWLKVLSGVFVVTGFMTLISQNTDSAYMAVLAVFLVLLWHAPKKKCYFLSMLELLFMFGLGAKLMRLLLMLHVNPILKLDQLSNQLIFGKLAYVIMAISFVCWLICFFTSATAEKEEKLKKVLTILRNVIFIVIGILLLISIIILVKSTKGELTGWELWLAQKAPYLQYDNEWGNGRGFTWSFAAKMINELPPIRKLIGIGPDCFASYSYEFYEDLVRSKWGDNVLQNAHNEWMNHIACYGFVGAASYIGIFVSSFIENMKKSENEPIIYAVCACIAVYFAHNFFCYQQVLCTPFIFMFMGFARYRQIKMDREGKL